MAKLVGSSSRFLVTTHCEVGMSIPKFFRNLDFLEIINVPAIIIALTAVIGVFAISLAGEAAETVSEKDKSLALDKVAELIGEFYVFPDSGAKFSREFQRLSRDGKYSEYKDPQRLANQIDGDLERISNDKHLAFFYDPQMNSELRQAAASDEPAEDTMLEEELRRNLGFQKIEILSGNVGYLDLRMFYDPLNAGDKFVAAMNLLSDCSALIVDLRNNGGGWGPAVALMTTYFFPANEEQKELTAIYSRPDDRTYQSWTLPYVPGKRLADVPLYILTSKSTFSAAEEFCYNLKQLKRALIIGEKTRGGAHPIDYEPVGEYFVLMIPEMTSFHPLSGANWRVWGWNLI